MNQKLYIGTHIAQHTVHTGNTLPSTLNTACSEAEIIVNEMPSTCLTPKVCVRRVRHLMHWEPASFRCQACTHVVKGIFRAIEIALASFITLQHFHLSIKFFASFKSFRSLEYILHTHTLHEFRSHILCEKCIPQHEKQHLDECTQSKHIAFYRQMYLAEATQQLCLTLVFGENRVLHDEKRWWCLLKAPKWILCFR